LRTKLQHVWATAVETVGTFINHSLKSSEGPTEWLSFFSLAGSAFAHLENSPPVPSYEKLSWQETFRATSREASRLEIYTRLASFSSAVNAIHAESRSAAYYLVKLNLMEEMSVSVVPFSRDQFEEANYAYSEAEKGVADGEKMQVVLVAAGSVDSLRARIQTTF